MAGVRLSGWFIFQSTLSVRRATYTPCPMAHCTAISIHALREESDPMVVRTTVAGIISIHALREESDSLVRISECLRDYFNPRSP